MAQERLSEAKLGEPEGTVRERPVVPARDSRCRTGA
jgi:hypothetical protein